jgi:hypothetical protein
MEKKYIAIGGSVVGTAIIALLLIYGAFTDNTYYCESLKTNSEPTLMECDHLSSTEFRCYPYKENNTGYKDCSTKWLKVSDYVAEDNLTNIEETDVSKIEGTICKVINSNNLIKECKTEDNETYLYIVRF